MRRHRPSLTALLSLFLDELTSPTPPWHLARRNRPRIAAALAVALLFPLEALAQTITITSINGEPVPPADEVFIDFSLFEVFDVEWEATANA